MPFVNAPPKHNAKTSTAGKSSGPTKTNKERKEALEGLGALAQVPLIATKQYADAGAIGVYWPNVAQELANLADKQAVIANFIDPLIKVGPYTGLVTAILPLLMQIGVNHGVTSPGAMGTVPADMLAAQVETSLAAAELEALRQQRDMEKAAQAMRDEIKLARRDMTDSMASQRTTVEDA